MALSNRSKKVLEVGVADKRAEAEISAAIDANTSAVNGKTVVYSAIVTTGGGNAAEDVTISGVLATDQCYVQLSDDGTNNVSIVSAVCASGKVTVTFSGDPAADTIVNLLVIR